METAFQAISGGALFAASDNREPAGLVDANHPIDRVHETRYPAPVEHFQGLQEVGRWGWVEGLSWHFC